MKDKPARSAANFSGVSVSLDDDTVINSFSLSLRASRTTAGARWPRYWLMKSRGNLSEGPGHVERENGNNHCEGPSENQEGQTNAPAQHKGTPASHMAGEFLSVLHHC